MKKANDTLNSEKQKTSSSSKNSKSSTRRSNSRMGGSKVKGQNYAKKGEHREKYPRGSSEQHGSYQKKSAGLKLKQKESELKALQGAIHQSKDDPNYVRMNQNVFEEMIGKMSESKFVTNNVDNLSNVANPHFVFTPLEVKKGDLKALISKNGDANPSNSKGNIQILNSLAGMSSSASNTTSASSKNSGTTNKKSLANFGGGNTATNDESVSQSASKAHHVKNNDSTNEDTNITSNSAKTISWTTENFPNRNDEKDTNIVLSVESMPAHKLSAKVKN